MVCDSKSALYELREQDGEWKKRNPMGHEMEILMSIDRLKEENNNINRIYKWERSHQKKDAPQTETRSINEDADELATKCRDYCEEGLMTTTKKIFLPDGIVVLKLNGGAITKGMKEAIHGAYHDDDLKKFLCNKFSWTNRTFNKIDWEAHAHGLRKKPAVYVTAIIKLVHRWQPTFKRTNQYTKHRTSKSRCCLCDEVEEQHHYMKCTDQYYVLARKNEWLELKKKMKRWHLHDSIFQAIWTGMENWRQGNTNRPELRPNVDQPLMTNAIIHAYEEQTEIGWYHISIGRIARSWRGCMRLCFIDDEHKEGKVEGCIRDLVQNMWSMMLRLWRKRNDLEHGSKSFYSKADIDTMNEIVDICYEKFSSNAERSDKWIFEMNCEERKKEKIVSTLGWIELVGTVYVDEKVEVQELKIKIYTLLQRMRIGSIFAE